MIIISRVVFCFASIMLHHWWICFVSLNGNLCCAIISSSQSHSFLLRHVQFAVMKSESQTQGLLAKGERVEQAIANQVFVVSSAVVFFYVVTCEALDISDSDDAGPAGGDDDDDDSSSDSIVGPEAGKQAHLESDQNAKMDAEDILTCSCCGITSDQASHCCLFRCQTLVCACSNLSHV